MQILAVLLVCLAAANAYVMPAPYLVRTPAHDSAIIKSDRLGGNFAWSTVEGHAYAAVTPVVQRVLTPVGVSHHAIAAPYYGYPYGVYPQFVAPAQVDAKAGQAVYVANNTSRFIL
ncbi:hypothetical protein GHT06_009740 [Daphnia sinensis]|uniref:Uncharacterized protein n=1 Tax=Daphnia sinensis TaxID=1820382 RepID=A0AAD5L6P5_9CRUS|nr:hypothetical protein GHT06_009740 [Daphnia sinensis]